MTDKIYGMIGLSRKSGSLVLGFDLVEEQIKKRKLHLVIYTSDSSEKGRNNLIQLCEEYDVKYLEHGSKHELGKILNKLEVSFVGIRDKNMAEYIIKHD
jgi:ribosomal protein L7Ae-like RNA K-turn-binding protein